MIFTVTFSPTLDYTLRLKQLELGVLCYIRDKCRENGLKYYHMVTEPWPFEF